MPTVEQITELLTEFAGDPEVAEELAREIVALDEEPAKETRVITVAEKR
jgi:hypothetical protein